MEQPATVNTFIIAEAGVNHNGSLGLAKQLVDAAAEAGADAVKFQTFKAEYLVTPAAERAAYQKRNMPGRRESQLEMIKALELSYDSFRLLKKYCDKKGITFLTSTADIESTEYIRGLVPVLKVGSSEVTNIPFLEYVAGLAKPVILSTGMSTLAEVEKAVAVLKGGRPGRDKRFAPLTLLHCTTNYPCPPNEVNLRAMVTLREAFGLPVGYSDHTLGAEVAVAAAAMGAAIVEKHLTLDKTMEGPDHKASADPAELAAMVRAIRNIETALGNGRKVPNKSELEIMKVARKSIVANAAIARGTLITPELVSVKRPGSGIPPHDLPHILGLRLRKDKKAGDVLQWGDFKG